MLVAYNFGSTIGLVVKRLLVLLEAWMIHMRVYKPVYKVS
jgi:hypothetical protein